MSTASLDRGSVDDAAIARGSRGQEPRRRRVARSRNAGGKRRWPARCRRPIDARTMASGVQAGRWVARPSANSPAVAVLGSGGVASHRSAAETPRRFVDKVPSVPEIVILGDLSGSARVRRSNVTRLPRADRMLRRAASVHVECSHAVRSWWPCVSEFEIEVSCTAARSARRLTAERLHDRPVCSYGTEKPGVLERFSRGCRRARTRTAWRPRQATVAGRRDGRRRLRTSRCSIATRRRPSRR